MTNRNQFSKDYELKNQIRRATISSMTNIAEGFARFHKKDFTRFLDISQSSTEEVKSLLYIALDQNYITKDSFKEVYDLANEPKRVTLGLLRHVKSTIEQSSKVVREPKAEYRTKSDSEFLGLPEEFIYNEHH